MKPLILALALGAAGCAPTCIQVCAKIDRCALEPSVTNLECSDACDIQLEDVRNDVEATRQEAFEAHRRCIGSATCEELEDGVCFDETLFVF